jgi:hypothetical protein
VCSQDMDSASCLGRVTDRAWTLARHLLTGRCPVRGAGCGVRGYSPLSHFGDILAPDDDRLLL